MEDNLRLLALERKTLARMKETVAEYQEHLEQTDEYQALQDAKEEAKQMQDDVSRVETIIKDIIHTDFLLTKENRKPHAGIQIKEFSVIRVLDENAAKQWASNNAPGLLSLNKSKFNRAVKELELDFVYKDKEYRVQIASDLSQYEDIEPDTSDTAEE